MLYLANDMLHVLLYDPMLYLFFLSVNSSDVFTDPLEGTSVFFYNYTDLVSCQISKYQIVSYV